ncbi:MAG: bifunctional proline dehydrogenase/L-glutamate gamma-semialdehyde dehydrogenase PutA [Xanthobacteraceae bacterium]|nr:MAG: bifunctional proline dehydrogenase/L-glutamate gamma-semialdehyde dehydrogenase PutA [Xanthobacteraceae bacterium]
MVFNAPYAEDDAAMASRLLAARWNGEQRQFIQAMARHLIETIRARGNPFGGIEDLLREYAISSTEGVALMVLAEALLRIPEDSTADHLIEDKLRTGDFLHHQAKSESLLVNAAVWALGISARIIQPDEMPASILSQLAKRLGLPTLRVAARQAVRALGNHFILGQTIEEALTRAQAGQAAHYRYSFDILGEGARTAEDARHYVRSYAAAIDAIGQAAGHAPLPNRPGISVKLSALHPRFEALSRERVMRELVPNVTALARQAKSHDLNLTIDAEEADRLELTLDVFAAVIADSSTAGWDGFGLAVQAYQKRADAVIDHVAALARAHSRRLMVRLVKGAYWDTEIKRAQERGLDDYPVFTRKAMTDLNYMACARKLLGLRPLLYPQFATHNALTVAALVQAAGNFDGYEFQRLHGMGEALYSTLLDDNRGAACRIYAPVGGHRELLGYLVRRFLENGANSSFVSVVTDKAVAIEDLLKDPADIIGASAAARSRAIPLPRDLYGPDRINSSGLEFGHRASLDGLLAEAGKAIQPRALAAPVIDGNVIPGAARASISPIDGTTTAGEVVMSDASVADRAVAAARAGFAAWSMQDVEMRAATLERASDLIEKRRGRLLHLLAVEAGKTLDDAVTEIREAVDFCRYYASEARRLFGDGQRMPGPTGESNVLAWRPRGVFIAISPWNFPLAIFVGQIAAALACGNTVVAKPAEQTPLIAAEAVRILHEAGLPASALHFVPGDGAIGALLVAHPDVAGVVFTGSTEVARAINRTLAAKEGPIVPLIAETGGVNAMLVDATALPEQVADDVLASAFRSTGQRCSSLRLLCIQDDVADRMIDVIVGAARELKIGDPRDPSTHIGPVIDREAKGRLDDHIAAMMQSARLHYAGTAPTAGTYVAPHLFELDRPEALTEEVFGPILHVVRYAVADFDRIIEAIGKSGYGLTLGIHSRIDDVVAQVTQRLPIGNVYVNRSMIGAVVGVQPFGGCGLSGTGPKAGGPHYLPRFATEQTLTINSAATGGNAALISGCE